MAGMRVERLDHLGIVAGVCQDPQCASPLGATLDYRRESPN